MEEIKLTTHGDKTGTIDSLIKHLNKAKKQGATHYRMEWSNDPMWAFKWFVTYKKLSEEETLQKKINELEQDLGLLKKQKEQL